MIPAGGSVESREGVVGPVIRVVSSDGGGLGVRGIVRDRLDGRVREVSPNTVGHVGSAVDGGDESQSCSRSTNENQGNCQGRKEKVKVDGRKKKQRC